MTKSYLIQYCLDHYDCFEDYPFGEATAVLKQTENKKMFALVAERDGVLYINLKCDPDEALSLRDTYKGISEGYHMNKKHWNTVLPDCDIPFELVETLIENSYNLVKPKIKKSHR